MKKGISLADGTVILLCLAGAFISFRFFWLDFHQTFSQINAVPLGTVTWKYKAAQRRFIDRVLWEQLQTEASVYAGDSIRTAEHSEATITFIQGIVIEMMENSLMQLSAEKNLPLVILMRGDIDVNASAVSGGTSLLLNTGDKQIQITGGSVMSARTTPDGSFTLRVSEGSVVIEVDGETQRFTSGESLTLDIDGNTLTEPLTVMLSPRPGARFLQNGIGDAALMPVEYVWNEVNYESGDRTRIDIAADRGFQRIITTLEEGWLNHAAASLKVGIYFWRAYPVKGIADTNRAAKAALGKLTIVSVPSPRLLLPEESQEYRYRSQPPAVRFQWTVSPEIAFYALEAADNPGLTNPALQTTVRGSSEEGTVSLTYSGLGNGRWYWRVNPALAEGFEGTENQGFVEPSAIHSFIITQTDSLPAPTLQSPPAGSFINSAEGTAINFSWQSEAEAASYTLLVSTNADLQDPVFTRQVTANYYRYTPEDWEGRYYWGVYQSAGDGTVSAISAPWFFTAMAGELRPLFPPDNYTMPAGLQPEFTWKTDLPYPLRLQISDTPSFSRLLIDEAVSGERFRAPPSLLRNGRWYWRISAERTSTPARTIQVIPALTQPVLTGPLPDTIGQTRRVLARPGEATAFTWQAVPGADYYTFRLYAGNSPAGNPVYSASPIERNRLETPLEGYREGRYTWTVEAFTEETAYNARQAGPAGSARFELRILPIPLLREAGRRRPANGYLIGPGQLRASPTITFTWDAVPGANRYSFALYREDGRTLIRRRDPSAQRSYTLDDLSPLGSGNFIWQVEALAVAEDGYIEQRGTLGENRFTLNIPVPRQIPVKDPGKVYGQ
ncbi:hypothetical protein AGMMS4952_04470 [Spirochaetia bacterium]|nr:hypothetical protein AGMMS4952_04470 [Spirochaetia bacterium]